MHPGSGLGNMLHRYVATRVLAEEKGYEFGIVNAGIFKGKDFMKLDMGKPHDLWHTIEEPAGKVKVVRLLNEPAPPPLWEEWDKHTYDPDFNFVEDNTIIDGNFEDERYFEHRMPEIKGWLKTEVITVPDDVCVIGFRGGEYYTVPELGLPREWYKQAITEMRARGIKKFEVHTDDLEMAKNWFPNFKVFRDIELNWQSVRYAKNAIIANSSFYVLPRLMNGGLTIAPRYWNRYNIKQWEYSQGYYKKFTYI